MSEEATLLRMLQEATAFFPRVQCLSPGVLRRLLAMV